MGVDFLQFFCYCTYIILILRDSVDTMKKDIHPKYNEKSKASCACGSTFTVGSTKDSLKVEVCSACHPHYTGKKKILDTMGRVEKFKERMAKKQK